MLRRACQQQQQQQQHDHLYGLAAAATLVFLPSKASLRLPQPKLASPSLHLPLHLPPKFHQHVFSNWAALLSSCKPSPLPPAAAAISASFCTQATLARGATNQFLHEIPQKRMNLTPLESVPAAQLLHKKLKKRKKLTSLESLSLFLFKVKVAHRVGWILQEIGWNAGAEKAIQALQVQWDPQIVVQVLRYPLTVDVAWGFFCWLKKVKGYMHNPYTYNTMLEIFGALKNTGRIQEMLKLMGEDGCPMNVVTHTRLLYWYGKAGEMEKAESVFAQMKALDCKPNIVTFTTLLHLHFKGKDFPKMRQIYMEMVDSGERPNSATYTVMINCLANMGFLDSALFVFDSIESLEAIPTFVSYGILMNAFAKAGNLKVLWGLYERMHNSGVCLNQRFYSMLVDSLHAAGKLEEAEDFIEKIRFYLKEDSNPTNVSMRTLREGNFDEDYCLQEVLHAFDGQFVDKELEDPYGAFLFDSFAEEEAPFRPKINIRALSGVFLNWDDKAAEALDAANIKWDGHKVLRMLMALKSGDVAWKFFNWVRDREGYKHNVFTYSKMIDILARNRFFKNAQVLLEEMQDKKLPVSVATFNSLIFFLSTSGNLTEALKLFYWMKESHVDPNNSTFTILIDMFAKHKRNDKALEMYKRMLEAGLRPDSRTYSSFIKSIAEEGKVEAAYSIFQRMQEFGCHPHATIFTALIDAFYKKEDMEKTLELYVASQDNGIELLPATYRLVAKAFKRVGNMEEANRIKEDIDLLGSSKQKRVDSITVKEVHNTFLEALSKAERRICYSYSIS